MILLLLLLLLLAKLQCLMQRRASSDGSELPAAQGDYSPGWAGLTSACSAAGVLRAPTAAQDEGRPAAGQVPAPYHLCRLRSRCSACCNKATFWMSQHATAPFAQQLGHSALCTLHRHLGACTHLRSGAGLRRDEVFVPGLLGIGGGIVIGPLLLELGADPVMAAATSALMVLFSSSSAALAYGTPSFCWPSFLQHLGRRHQACPACKAEVMRQNPVCVWGMGGQGGCAASDLLSRPLVSICILLGSFRSWCRRGGLPQSAVWASIRRSLLHCLSDRGGRHLPRCAHFWQGATPQRCMMRLSWIQGPAVNAC